MTEGYIKYRCNLIKKDLEYFAGIDEFIFWRQKLYDMHLIGAYPSGIGYGNLSIRNNYLSPQNIMFFITGTATGSIEILNISHIVKVTQYDIEKNELTCEGKINASSESLTHAAIYECDPEINAVIHIHHLQMWRHLIDAIPTTPRNVTYGTPEMAYEIQKIIKCRDARSCVSDTNKNLIVMGGHDEGLIAYGKNLAQAGNIILDNFAKII